MALDAQLTFADHMARFCARRYSYPPMVGRVLGYLAVCEPPAPTIAELSDALLASRSAITNAITTLESVGQVKRSRAAGERMDRISIDITSARGLGMDNAEYEELGALAREGLEVLRDAPPERRAVLSEIATFTEFLTNRIPALYAEWQKEREVLIAAGEIPASPPEGTRS
ncbi:MarR family transcriptional regulator [Gordonia alkanivorans]|uniref:GbsR/MarR family transcriptional regulator n=1 Tax=Gordonia alkanivorans TaxID=84096 RepID=UPI000FDDC346|nr:MarR family transcriptional regulator [Gordonia alkanivorans]AZZ82533.1 MarR family transcriptional regulator [Gordonia alkanivorans]